MNLVNGTARAVTGVGAAATATLGAVGGAAVGGLVGSMKGAAVGAQEGARRGSHSTPAAVLTMGAVAVTGVVQWPIVAAVGGTALILDQLKLGTTPDKPRTGEQSTGPGTTTDTGAKPAAVSAAPAEAKTPTPAGRAVRGRRTPANTPPSKSAPSSTS
ncbi:hypothetical protein [Rhodococcus wratislaviensis]|uniref:Transmembrane protein n=1 Tax=Rhodococcus wratislaviensis NBRC 100605 TaxID=1219028 RepID=X0PRI1_RHOWR|nr:hypothetical protein [Rhodococcus wratislaviensis]GAF45463.1 hypothetical protein RW1_022_00400 [Rhodococcus wratislaviensis NBRC 100605]